eukprot:2724534-Pyramimonas_sp.AAC.1
MSCCALIFNTMIYHVMLFHFTTSDYANRGEESSRHAVMLRGDRQHHAMPCSAVPCNDIRSCELKANLRHGK